MSESIVNHRFPQSRAAACEAGEAMATRTELSVYVSYGEVGGLLHEHLAKASLPVMFKFHDLLIL